MSINVVGRVVNGTSGNDIGLTGGSGDDRIQGLDGNDTILGNAGADINDGGNGNDTVDYSASQAGIGVDLGQNWGTGGDAQGDTYISIENITGSAFSDTIFGDGHSNVLNGGAGNDYLYGMDGNDTLRGGDGNDVLQGGNGSDIIVGGDGNDVITGGADGDSLDGGAGNNTLSYAGSQAGVSINLSTSVVQFGDAEGDKIINFQNVTGSEFNDTLVGDNNANRLSGGGGGDVIAGGGGNDHIDGGFGDDILIGGAGADIFHFSTGTALSGLSGGASLTAGKDVIKDFEVGVDKLEFFGHEQSIHDLKLHQVGDDVVIEFNQGVAILEHVSLTGLMQHQGDFIFL